MRNLMLVAGLLLSACCWGCAGGSTGQETDESYDICTMPEEERPFPQEDLSQEEVDALVELIEGTYATTLYWVDRDLDLPGPPNLVEDAPATAMTIEVRYAGTDVASRGCTGVPQLPFVVRMTTEDGALDWEFLGSGSLLSRDVCFAPLSNVEFTTEDPTATNENEFEARLVQVASLEDLALPRYDDPDGPLDSLSFLCFGPSDGATRGDVRLRSGERGVWPDACGFETRPVDATTDRPLLQTGTYETTGEQAGLLRLSLASTSDELVCVVPDTDETIASQQVTIELGADSWEGMARVAMVTSGEVFGSAPCFEATDAETLTELLTTEATSVCATGDNPVLCESLLGILDVGIAGARTCLYWTLSGETMTVDADFNWHLADGEEAEGPMAMTMELVAGT